MTPTLKMDFTDMEKAFPIEIAASTGLPHDTRRMQLSGSMTAKKKHPEDRAFRVLDRCPAEQNPGFMKRKSAQASEVRTQSLARST